MIRILICSIALLLSFECLSQSDFQQGYIVTNSLDTVKGFLDTRSEGSPFNASSFKKERNAAPVLYEPNQIKGYGYGSRKFFETKTLKIKGAETTLFLQVLARGNVSLYDNGENFFIQKGNDEPLELSNQVQSIDADGKEITKQSKRYIGILTLVMQDRPELASRIKRIRLNENQLVMLVQNYNSSHGSTTTKYKASKPSLRILPGVEVGANFSNIHFKPHPIFYDHLKGSFRLSRAPIAGFSFDILSPRISERSAFHIDVLYGISKYFNHNQIKYSTNTTANYTTIELHQLKIPIAIKYVLPVRKFTSYFLVGLSSTLHLKSYSQLIQEDRSGESINTTTKTALPIKSHQFGYWAGFGVGTAVNNKMVLYSELRWEHTNGIINEPADPNANQKCAVNNFQIVIGIRKK